MNGRIVSLIALVPMLFHSMFGCCWHHSHDHAEPTLGVVECDGHATDSADDHDAPDLCHSDCVCFHVAGSATERAPCGDHSGSSRPCDDERCSYVGALTTLVSQPISLKLWAPVQFVFADLHVALQSLLTACREPLERSRVPSSLERRAFIQVWQI